MKEDITLQEIISRAEELENLTTLFRTASQTRERYSMPLKYFMYEKYIESVDYTIEKWSSGDFSKDLSISENARYSSRWNDSMTTMILKLRHWRYGGTSSSVVGFIDQDDSWSQITDDFNRIFAPGSVPMSTLCEYINKSTVMYNQVLSRLTRDKWDVEVPPVWYECHHIVVNGIKALFRSRANAEAFLFNIGKYQCCQDRFQFKPRIIPLAVPAQQPAYSKIGISDRDSIGQQIEAHSHTSSTIHYQAKPVPVDPKWSEPALVDLLQLRLIKYGVLFEVFLDDRSFLYEEICQELKAIYSYDYKTEEIVQYIDLLKKYYLDGLHLLQKTGVDGVAMLPSAWHRLHQIFLQEAQTRGEQRVTEAKYFHYLFADTLE